MKVFTNEKLIKRNGRIGQLAMIGGLVVLVGGMIISFRYPTYSAISWVTLIIGFGLSQVGIYMGNRWGRNRLDQALDKGVKGLNDQYSIYHYTTPAAHLLVGPSGLWVIMPYYQVGKIVYEKGRWKQQGGGFKQWYMRVFAQEGIGRPDIEAREEVDSLSRFLKKNFPDQTIPDARSVLVFTNENADLQVGETPILTIPLKKLKETIRKSTKENILPPEVIQQINELFA